MVIFYSCNSPSLLTLISSYHFIHSIVPSNSFINNFVIPYLCFPSINFFWNIIYWEVPKDAGKMPRECRRKCWKKTLWYSLISPSILSHSPAHSPALIFLYCVQFYPLKSIKCFFVIFGHCRRLELDIPN